MLTLFFFGVFRRYQYYFRVPPGIRVPQGGNHWPKQQLAVVGYADTTPPLAFRPGCRRTLQVHDLQKLGS
jgi:hypothetical protein